MDNKYNNAEEKLLTYLYVQNIFQRTQIKMLTSMVLTLATLHNRGTGERFEKRLVGDELLRLAKDELHHVPQIQPYLDKVVQEILKEHRN